MARQILISLLIAIPICGIVAQSKLSYSMDYQNLPLLGLAPQHQTEAAIMERIAPHKNNTDADISRVYADGSYYLLFYNPHNSENAWFKLSNLSTKGLELLMPLLDHELINLIDQATTFAPGQGFIIWRIHTECAYYEIKTAAGVYESLPPIIKKIDDTINQNLLPQH